MSMTIQFPLPTQGGPRGIAAVGTQKHQLPQPWRRPARKLLLAVAAKFPTLKEFEAKTGIKRFNVAGIRDHRYDCGKKLLEECRRWAAAHAPELIEEFERECAHGA